MPKITALTAATALTADDYLVAVNDPAGTPGTRRITASDARGFLAPVGAAPVRIVVPYYDYTSFNDADMTTIIDNPSYSPVVIVNVNTGPGVAVNTDFQHEIARMDAAGITVVGYVTCSDTGSGPLAASTVKADVDTWYTLYRSSGLKGIFFDLTPTGASGSYETYVADICYYAQAKGPGHIVVSNPGTYPLTVDYLNPPDIVCVWEADWNSGAYLSMAVPGYAEDYVAALPAGKMLHLVYNATTAADARSAMEHAASVRARCFYATSGGSLWTVLATHYAEQATHANSQRVPIDPTDRREHHGPLSATTVAGFPAYAATAVGAATYTPDMSLACVHEIDLTGNATIAAPTNGHAGMSLTLVFLQSSGTTNTATLNSVYKRAGGTFTASTGSSAKSSISFAYDGTNWIETGRALAVA